MTALEFPDADGSIVTYMVWISASGGHRNGAEMKQASWVTFLPVPPCHSQAAACGRDILWWSLGFLFCLVFF